MQPQAFPEDSDAILTFHPLRFLDSLRPPLLKFLDEKWKLRDEGEN